MQNYDKITAFCKNHGIHGNYRKSRLSWLPWFRDFLLPPNYCVL